MPRIEQRSIQAVGKGGYYVTLPKGWVEFFHLKKGDKVEVESNYEITIRVPKPLMTTSS